MRTIFTILIFLSAINLFGQTVVIENDSIDVNFSTMRDNRYKHNHTHSRFGFFSFIQVDIMFNDFSAFKNDLGEHNIDFMNRSTEPFMWGLGGTYQKWLAELNFGYSFNSGYKNDSLTVKFNSTRFGIGFGYNLVKNKKLLVTPRTSINWNRYRLINSTKEKVLLEEYVHNRDLDIRLNQLTGFVGLNISYKFYNHFILSTNYWAVGLYGGYIFQFNEKPWIYSVDKRLINKNIIDLKNYSLGIRVSWNIE